jgi:hypothetical protein
VQRIFSFLLLLFLPLAALADGRVIPTFAYPAKITIPDQRALICFSNGTERLVIETRFTGAGTNFAWVVPLPGQPVIEEATTGLFPTLQYLFRPKIIHNVPQFYLGVLIFTGIITLLRLAKKSAIDIVIYALLTFLFLFLAAALLPAARSAGRATPISNEAVSILDRKIVGVFETTTIKSHDAKALHAWLSENGFAVPTNAEPVIASYVKDGWVFVATKVRRDKPDNETSTPHPLSFTFKTNRPVYPMRLTGVDNGPLSIEFYVFGSLRATAAHFKVESCTRPTIVHPLLRKWAGDSATVTKLIATLSPNDMRQDVWLDWTPFLEKKNRLFSQQGALTTALNWGVGLFTAGLVVIWLMAFASETHKTKLPQRIGIVTVASIILTGLFYLCLPKIEVKLVKGRTYFRAVMEQKIVLEMILDDGGWRTIAEARATLQKETSNPTNAIAYGVTNWDNYMVGGQIREEDSPGNYLLRETNNQLQFVTIGNDGGEYIHRNWDLPHQHQTP